MLVSRLRFRYAVDGYKRPRSGDLIYIGLTNGFFEITDVESENDQAMFYTLGRGRGGNVYVYALKLKKFAFSNEVINTGVFVVDNAIRDYYPRERISLHTGSGLFLNDEIVYQGGTNVATSTAQALVYDCEPNQHIDIYLKQGDFAAANVVGNTSNATWTISKVSDEPTMNTAFDDIFDNARIEEGADSIIDFTENNPFGEA